MKESCPCCGYFTFDSDDEIIFDICEVCYWQYDKYAHNNSNVISGANRITLNQARKNYKDFGVCDEKYIGKNRNPVEEELPENN